jgi:hypothetical protein
VKANFGGPHKKKRCSLLAPSTVSLFVMMSFLFLGRVFDGPWFLFDEK